MRPFVQAASLNFPRLSSRRTQPTRPKWPMSVRLMSTTDPPPSAQLPYKPPTALNEEMALGVAACSRLFLRYGVGNQRLLDVAKDAGQDKSTLVGRWQRMMEAFLGTQVHVMAGLGYSPDDSGVAMYNQHLGLLMQNADPAVQEKLRLEGRDMWREVLSTAFNVDLEKINAHEMSIVDARNLMHKVSQKIQDPEIVESVARQTANITEANHQEAMRLKHAIVQETLVNKVYLGGNPTLVSECGFEDGEEGYIMMQCAIAEYQSDPLVAQYIGTAMMALLQAAGIGPESLPRTA